MGRGEEKLPVNLKTPHERLQWARRRAGYDDAKSAAAAFGWPYQTYKKTEAGERSLTPKKATKYATGFRVPAAWLLTGEGSPFRAAAPDEIELIRKYRGLGDRNRRFVHVMLDNLLSDERPFAAEN